MNLFRWQKCAEQIEMARLRLVQTGEQSVHGPQSLPMIDLQTGVTMDLGYAGVFVRGRFQRPHDSCAHGDDTTASRPRLLALPRGESIHQIFILARRMLTLEFDVL